MAGCPATTSPSAASPCHPARETIRLKVNLSPKPLRAPKGGHGWKVQIPGNRPLATPAYDGGKVFIGGGFGSHEFYLKLPQKLRHFLSWQPTADRVSPYEPSSCHPLLPEDRQWGLSMSPCPNLSVGNTPVRLGNFSIPLRAMFIAAT